MSIVETWVTFLFQCTTSLQSLRDQLNTIPQLHDCRAFKILVVIFLVEMKGKKKKHDLGSFFPLLSQGLHKCSITNYTCTTSRCLEEGNGCFLEWDCLTTFHFPLNSVWEHSDSNNGLIEMSTFITWKVSCSAGIF